MQTPRATAPTGACASTSPFFTPPRARSRGQSRGQTAKTNRLFAMRAHKRMQQKKDCANAHRIGISGECQQNRWLNRTNMNQSINRLVNQFLIAAILLSAPVLLAGAESYKDPKDSKVLLPPEVQPWCETPAPLEIRVGIPGWMAGVSGNSGVKGVVTSPDVSFDQLLRHLTHVPLSLSVDVRYQRWEFFGDGLYMEVGASATLPGLLFTNANIHLKTGLAEGFVGYRVISCDKAALSFFAGARYSYQGGDLSIFDNGDARLVRLRQLLGIRKKLDFS